MDFCADPPLQSITVICARVCVQVIRFEMGAFPEEIFAEFDPEPLASASLAQVHRARLHSGEEVAVKVQHAGLHESSQVDIRIIQGLVDIVCWMFPKFQYRWFVDEVRFLELGMRSIPHYFGTEAPAPWLMLPASECPFPVSLCGRLAFGCSLLFLRVCS